MRDGLTWARRTLSDIAAVMLIVAALMLLTLGMAVGLMWLLG